MLEVDIIPFWIDDTELEALLRHALREGRRECRFAAPSRSCDQHASAIGLKINIVSSAIDPDANAMPRFLGDICIFVDQLLNQLDHASAMIADEFNISFGFHRRQSIGHSRTIVGVFENQMDVPAAGARERADG